MTLSDDSAAMAWFTARPEWNSCARARLEQLAELLRAENQRQNLVAQASLETLWLRHYADSAQLLEHVPRGTAQSWLDLGSGAGFPGLVVAILRPDWEVVLAESRTRRITWLVQACAELNLANAIVAGDRVEMLPPRKFSVISARAFAPLPKLLELSARFSTSDTVWLLPKGRSARQELSELSGWDHMFHVEQSLTDADSGVIVGTLNGRKGKKA